jgi:hypothetical protein
MSKMNLSFANRWRHNQGSGCYCYDELLDPISFSGDLEGTTCISTGGALAMLRKKLRFHRSGQKLNPNAICSHCIHQHALESKTLPHYLKDGLDFVTQAINLNLAKTNNSCVFKAPCEKNGCKYATLSLRREIRWNILTGFLEPRYVIKMYLPKNGSVLLHHDTDPNFVVFVAY